MELMEKLITDNLPEIKRKCSMMSYKFFIEFEGLLGDVLEKMWRSRTTYTHVSDKSFMNWVSNVVYTSAVSNYRNNKKHRAMTVLEEITGDPVKNNYPSQNHLEYIHEYLEKKHGADKHAIVQLIADGYKYDEAAEILGVSIGTLKSNLHRVRKDLQKQRIN